MQSLKTIIKVIFSIIAAIIFKLGHDNRITCDCQFGEGNFVVAGRILMICGYGGFKGLPDENN